MGTAPTLGLIKRAYGSHVAVAWAKVQIQNVEEFSGVKEKLNDQQRHDLSVMICVEYGHLKLSELALFFFRLKMGKYGKFYGCIDPMVITEALCEFANERRDILDRYERERRHEDNDTQRAVVKKGAMTYEEWVAKKREADPDFQPII